MRPRYAGEAQEYLVKMIAEVLRGSVGLRKGEVDERVRELEAYGHYRFVRGFYEIMLDRCEFVQAYQGSPRRLRELAFEAMSRRGEYTRKAARMALEDVAEQVGVSVDEILNAMWADLPENMILKSFNEPDVKDVIYEYNFRLLGSELRGAGEIKVWVLDRWQELLWAVKRLELMYQLEEGHGGSSLVVYGPAYMLHGSKAYGDRISLLLEAIVRAKRWSIRARVGRGELVADSDDPVRSGKGELTFDSEVERRFYRDFASIGTGWRIIREPGPLRAGNSVFLPDFAFEKNGIRVYMEIVGFWTQDYLERKIRKLVEANLKNMIVAVDAKNAKKMPQLPGHIIAYSEVPDAFKVKEVLSEIEKPIREQELERAMSVKVEGEFISLKRLAEMAGVSQEVMKEAIMKRVPEGYLFDGDNLISHRAAESLREQVLSLGTDDANSAIEMLRGKGIEASVTTLTTIGVKVKWHGLEARIDLSS